MQRASQMSSARQAATSETASSVLRGKILAISTLAESSQEESPEAYRQIVSLCHELGAQTTGQVHKRVHALVATESAMAGNGTQRVRKAQKKDIPIVAPEWLYACRNQRTCLDWSPYRLFLTSKKRVANDKKGTSGTSREVNPSAVNPPISLGCCCACHDETTASTTEACPWCVDCDVNQSAATQKASSPSGAVVDMAQGENKVERIYIGGLDPASLTIDEVLGRFPDSIQIDSLCRPNVLNPSYCHLSVRTIYNNLGDKQSSALEILQSLFHNVKWKGCKLQVQAARPHFLERLQSERQRLEEPPPDILSSLPEQSSAKQRYYRVHYAFGKPTCLVDSCPYQVSDAKAFSKMVQHVRKRKVSHSMANTATSKKPFRAVHWRLENSESRNIADSSNRWSDSEASLHSLHSSQSSTTSSDSNQTETGRFVWSDEEPGFAVGKSSRKDKLLTPLEESDHQELQKSRQYVWSDDDDDDDKDGIGGREESNGLLATQNSILDEFHAGLDHEESAGSASVDNAANTDDADDPDNSISSHDDLDMEKDESRNLHILAELFPDMRIHQDRSQSNDAARESEIRDGWNARGQMMRYDPREALSKHLLQSTEEDVDNESSHSTDSNESEKKPSEEMSRRETDMAVLPMDSSGDSGQVYHQDALESVFREAREAQADGNVRRLVGNDTQIASKMDGTGFSFSFAVDQGSSDLVDQSGFSFDFQASDKTTEAAVQAATATDDNEMERTEMTANDKVPVKRRKLQSSFEELDHYVNAYLLELNQGEAIATDLNAFRSNPKVQEDWDVQRRRLTSDWKSKRKSAISRRKK